MPNYQYSCSHCKHVFEEQLKIVERKLPTEQPCPNCQQDNSIELSIGAVALCSPFALGITKPTSDFRDRMTEIKENHKNVRNLSGNIKEY